MSEQIDRSHDSVDETIFYAGDKDLSTQSRDDIFFLLEELRIPEEARVDWLHSYYDQNTAPRNDIAWIFACKALFAELETKELLAGSKPSARFVCVPNGLADMHGLDVQIADTGLSLQADLQRLNNEYRFAVDEDAFKHKLAQQYFNANPVFRFRHAETGHPFDGAVPQENYVFGGELFRIMPYDELTLKRGDQGSLPATDNWGELLEALAIAEAASLRAESAANSLQHAWRIDGQQESTDTLIDQLLG